jgi:hypothetical protein
MFVFQFKDKSAGSVWLQLRHLKLHSEFLSPPLGVRQPSGCGGDSVVGLIVITDKRDALDLFSRSGRFLSYAPEIVIPCM